MWSSLSLFDNKTYNAGQVKYPDVDRLRLACPECLEPVTLVVKYNTTYFAHFPVTEASPDCPLRTENPGGGSGWVVANRIIHEDVFIKVFCILFQISPIVDVKPELETLITELMRLMQRTWLKKKQMISMEDLPALPEDYLPRWNTPGRYIEALALEQRELDIEHSKQEKIDYKTQALTASFLWRQLHLKKTEKDLKFLLKFNAMNFAPTTGIYTGEYGEANRAKLFANLIKWSLEDLFNITWADADKIIASAVTSVCGVCERSFEHQQKVKASICYDCHRTLCFNCTMVCEECGREYCTYCLGEHNCTYKWVAD